MFVKHAANTAVWQISNHDLWCAAVLLQIKQCLLKEDLVFIIIYSLKASAAFNFCYLCHLSIGVLNNLVLAELILTVVSVIWTHVSVWWSHWDTIIYWPGDMLHCLMISCDLWPLTTSVRHCQQIISSAISHPFLQSILLLTSKFGSNIQPMIEIRYEKQFQISCFVCRF